ncbi:hypothetical protein [Microvirga splendida]|uniref:Uncharacterized protein n=1 Tax=Microvirga splendida TaxID=2795727 RepID=A0ABS0XZG4_9HYPH|nr:hypothetical protein [Microvirga splendida]MBJ6125416.1 hypothetical protein [Microvirga splendida]
MGLFGFLTRAKVGHYVAFSFNERFPEGGMNDYLGDFGTIKEAITFALTDNDDFAKDFLHLWQPQALRTHVYVATRDRRGYMLEQESA